MKTLVEATHEHLIKESADAEYFLVSGRLPFDEGILSVAKRLKMVQRSGVGIGMLDIEDNTGPLGLGGKHSVMATFAKVGPQRASSVRIVALRSCCCFEPRRASVEL